MEASTAIASFLQYDPRHADVAVGFSRRCPRRCLTGRLVLRCVFLDVNAATTRDAAPSGLPYKSAA